MKQAPGFLGLTIVFANDKNTNGQVDLLESAFTFSCVGVQFQQCNMQNFV